MKKLYLFLFVWVFVFCSCKKEGDTFAPQITISKPFENEQFSYSDQVNVVGTVCDDRKLTSIDVNITDEAFVNVASSPTIYPVNSCYDLNVNIPINNSSLLSGNYYVVVTASDGINTSRKFVEIKISAVTKKLNYLLVVSKNGNQIRMNKIDSTNTVSVVKEITSDYCGSAVSSDAQQFYIAGHYNGDVQVFSTIDWQSMWNIPCIVSPPFPYFEAIEVHDKMLYVSYSSGKFEVYNAAGSINTLRVIDNAYFPTRFTPVDDLLLTYERSPSEMVRQLVVYYVPSYSIQQKMLLNCELHDIYKKDDNHCIMFSNYNNYATIDLYTISNHTFWSASTLLGSNIISTAQVDATDYLYIEHNTNYSDYTVNWFNYNYPGGFPLYYAQNIGNLAFDETQSNYYISEDYHYVKQFVFPNHDVVSSVYIPDTIINILPVYNKD
jgi:hypothetical protein